jgi:hypothetical protein
VQLTIDDAEEIGPFLWSAEIAPSDIAMFGTAPSSAGARTVLLLIEPPVYTPSRRQLRFDPRAVRPLNIGASREAILIGSSPSQSSARVAGVSPAEPVNAGDRVFLAALPGSLSAIGKSLLAGIREHFHGQLRLSEESKRYVETPDNFWTVKIQPRDISLRITVRGRPQHLPSPADLKVSDDRPGYSTFKVAAVNEVPSAIKVILGAGRRAQ